MSVCVPSFLALLRDFIRRRADLYTFPLGVSRAFLAFFRIDQSILRSIQPQLLKRDFRVSILGVDTHSGTRGMLLSSMVEK
jgi:hypothetical protein